MELNYRIKIIVFMLVCSFLIQCLWGIQEWKWKCCSCKVGKGVSCVDATSITCQSRDICNYWRTLVSWTVSPPVRPGFDSPMEIELYFPQCNQCYPTCVTAGVLRRTIPVTATGWRLRLCFFIPKTTASLLCLSLFHLLAVHDVDRWLRMQATNIFVVHVCCTVPCDLALYGLYDNVETTAALQLHVTLGLHKWRSKWRYKDDSRGLMLSSAHCRQPHAAWNFGTEPISLVSDLCQSNFTYTQRQLAERAQERWLARASEGCRHPLLQIRERWGLRLETERKQLWLSKVLGPKNQGTERL